MEAQPLSSKAAMHTSILNMKSPMFLARPRVLSLSLPHPSMAGLRPAIQREYSRAARRVTDESLTGKRKYFS
ncbi:MAG: hypothetical protein CME86_26815 [Herbaspirillum sp.]|nr:hypothetical protein [Herbaspirillum sp.]MBO15091.1 hypothetical protein [Herbaspirillum sp.]